MLLQQILSHPDVTAAVAGLGVDIVIMGDSVESSLKDAGVVLAVGQAVNYLEPMIGGLLSPILTMLPSSMHHLLMNNLSVVLKVVGYLAVAQYTSLLGDKYGGRLSTNELLMAGTEHMVVQFAANLLRGASVLAPGGAHHEKVAGIMAHSKKAAYGDDGK
ncbi:MAG: hypothetical protein KUG81_02320 [Gammaproteobacteria bacterium]|nr:hypothetical protein [Gammaproteobacteria bacterium]